MAALATVWPAALAETKLAYAAVLADPGRLLRFGGLPTVLALGLWGFLSIARPMPESEDPAVMEAWMAANAGYVLLAILTAMWSYGRLVVRWSRWTVTGDGMGGFFDPGLGGRELRTLGWSLLAGLCAMPTLLLLVLVGDVFLFLGASLFGLAGEEAALTGARLGAVLGGLIGLLPAYYITGRLLPGVAPVALDLPAALGPSWRTTKEAALTAMLTLWLIALPGAIVGTVLLQLDLGLALNVVGPVLSFLAYSATAVSMARLWQAVVAPAAPAAPERD